jgi:DNA-binding NtrC family response regulator
METLLGLVFDSDAAQRSRISAVLSAEGLDPVEAGTMREALDVLRARPVAVAVFDEASAGHALYELLERGLELRPTAVVGVMQDDPGARGVEAARAGAFDVFARPPNPGRLRGFVFRALAQHRLLEELLRMRGPADRVGELLLGRSEAIETLRRRVEELAAGADPVLFVGEPGSGRTQAARALFAAGGERFEIVRPEARDLARRLLDDPESPGTGLHVAEVHAIPLELQRRLAARFEAGRARARLTASTYVDPAGARGQASLHPALARAFDRTVTAIPPLRARGEDVPLLARAFASKLQRTNALPPIVFAPDALAALCARRWPGNVRELKEAVATAVVSSPDGVIRARDCDVTARGGDTPPLAPGAERSFRELKQSVVASFERRFLVDLMERHGGQVTAAATGAGMLRSALQRLLRKHDLHSCDFRGPS